MYHLRMACLDGKTAKRSVALASAARSFAQRVSRGCWMTPAVRISGCQVRRLNRINWLSSCDVAIRGSSGCKVRERGLCVARGLQDVRTCTGWGVEPQHFPDESDGNAGCYGKPRGRRNSFLAGARELLNGLETEAIQGVA